MRRRRPAWTTIVSAAGFAAAAMVAVPLPPALASDQPGAASFVTTGPIERRYDHTLASLRITLSAAAVTVADRLTLTLTAETEPATTVVWPDFGTEIPGFRIAGRIDEPARLADAGTNGDSAPRLMTTRRLTLEPFLPGRRSIPSLEVRFRPGAPNAKPFSITTQPIDVEVTSLLAEAGDTAAAPDPGALRSLATLPERNTTMWFIIGGAAATLIAGGSLTAWVLTRRSRTTTTDPIAALRVRLVRLAERADAAPPRDAHAELASILREYLLHRFAIPATERTTEELAPGLRAALPPGVDAAAIESLLARADRSKFAGDAPSPWRLREDLALVTALMDTAASAHTGGTP